MDIYKIQLSTCSSELSTIFVVRVDTYLEKKNDELLKRRT